MPKHYGIEKFGEPDLVKVGKGDPINIEFNGSLRPKQIPCRNIYEKLRKGLF